MAAKHLRDIFQYIDMHNGDESVCWEWLGPTAGRDERAYFTFKSRKLIAYRVVYELVHGPIPDGQVVRHKCDNQICCNPKHLELGTQQDNIADAKARDRIGTPAIAVRAIRKLASQGWTHQAIADLFELGRSTVTHIINGDVHDND